MSWKVIATEIFSREFKKHKRERERDSEFIKALNNKIKRFQENPENIGGYLAGNLHSYKSTRIVSKYRLIFKIMSIN